MLRLKNSKHRSPTDQDHLSDESQADGHGQDPDIAGTLDPLKGYEVISKPSRFFTIGRVFKTFWTEPAGNTSEDGGNYVTSMKFGENAFTKVRRFVVIREMQDHALCLPLNTYNGQGTSKPGIRADEYAPVHAQRSASPSLAQDPSRFQTSFPIVVERSGETIDPKSHVNFGRVYTVEHNVKVSTVGRIAPEYLSLLDQKFVDTIAKRPEGYSARTQQLQAESLHSAIGYISMDDVEAPSHYQHPYQKQAQAAPQSIQEQDEYHKLRYKAGKPEGKDLLDPSYTIRNRDYKAFFRTGKVFSTLWTDNYGGNMTNASTASSSVISSHGQQFYTKIRRFVVLRQGDRSCTCLPLTTYDGKGHNKRGINLAEHGQIYGDIPPSTILGISFSALHVLYSKNATKLQKGCLINYGKVYTVEMNVKVKEIGNLDVASRRLIRRYWNQTMIMDENSDSGVPKEKGNSTSLNRKGAVNTDYTYSMPSSQPGGYTASSGTANYLHHNATPTYNTTSSYNYPYGVAVHEYQDSIAYDAVYTSTTSPELSSLRPVDCTSGPASSASSAAYGHDTSYSVPRTSTSSYQPSTYYTPQNVGIQATSPYQPSTYYTPHNVGIQATTPYQTNTYYTPQNVGIQATRFNNAYITLPQNTVSYSTANPAYLTTTQHEASQYDLPYQDEAKYTAQLEQSKAEAEAEAKAEDRRRDEEWRQQRAEQRRRLRPSQKGKEKGDPQNTVSYSTAGPAYPTATEDETSQYSLPYPHEAEYA